MANSDQRDANFIPVLSGEGDNGLTLPWSIDHITGRVLVDIVISADSGASGTTNRALKDANYRNTLTGEADDLSGPLSCAIDHTNGLLAVDVLIE
jgi:hypothetical protein